MQRFIRKTLSSLIGVLALAIPPAWTGQPPPLTVSLSMLSPGCPPSIGSSVGLKAEATGGYQLPPNIRLPPGTPRSRTRYAFYAMRGNQSILMQEGPNSAVWWAPVFPGYYTFSVTAKQYRGQTVIAQATAQAPSGCDIKKMNLTPIPVQVSPLSGQAVAPPQSAAQRLTLTARPYSIANSTYHFRFRVGRIGYTFQEQSITTNLPTASWTPLNPAEPQAPGVYQITVWVAIYKSAPEGDVIIAEGQKEIPNYVANAPPLAAPQISLSVNPLSGNPTGNVTLNASVAPQPNTTNKFTFSWGFTNPQGGYQDFKSPSGTTANWRLDPQPWPGTYLLAVDVETRRPSDNAVATGRKEIQNYVVTLNPAYPYGWFQPITTQNTAEPVGMKIGAAEDTIAGNSIRAITGDGNVRVRANNTSCAQCHGGAWPEKTNFCNAAPGFVNNQGQHAGDTILKNLFNNWRGRNCPY